MRFTTPGKVFLKHNEHNEHNGHNENNENNENGVKVVMQPKWQKLEQNQCIHFQSAKEEKFIVEVLEDDIFRVQFLPDGKYRLKYSFVVHNHAHLGERCGHYVAVERDKVRELFKCPSFTYNYNDSENRMNIRSKHIELEIGFENLFHLTWKYIRAGESKSSNATQNEQILEEEEDTEIKEIASDCKTRSYAYDSKGNSVFHFMRRSKTEKYFGFGERTGALNKYGRRMIMKNVDALGYNAETSDPLYKHFPFYITFIPELNIAYGLFYDNYSISNFDMGQEIDAYHGDYRSYEATDGDLDYYFILGPSVADVSQKFAQRIIGTISLPPKYLLGYLGSTMTYTESKEAEKELGKFVELCKEHHIPCSLFHLSSGYCTNETDGKRYVFTWNKSRISNPKAMIQKFHDHDIHIAANIKPWLLETHPMYNDVLSFKGFIQSSSSSLPLPLPSSSSSSSIMSNDNYKPEMTNLWSGGCFESSFGSYLDFMNFNTFNWWKKKAKEQLLEKGVDILWNDNNEFEIWDDDALCDDPTEWIKKENTSECNEKEDKAKIRVGLVRSVQCLFMNLASFEAQKEAFPNRRPFVLTRSACPGTQRYAQSWSGDNNTSWHTLKYNIPMGLGLSISGFANTGHDVGGFAGKKPSPELFVRWVQNGIFHPRFCVHSWHEDQSVNEIWMYPEMLPIIRCYIYLREFMIPYLYTCLYGCTKNGTAIIAPLVYHFQHDRKCQDESFDYMFGPSILVASVTDPGVIQREIYLPEIIGHSQKSDKRKYWYDFYSSKNIYQGAYKYMIHCPLEKIPLFVPEGTIIPFSIPKLTSELDFPYSILLKENTSQICDGISNLFLHFYSIAKTVREHLNQMNHELDSFDQHTDRILIFHVFPFVSEGDDDIADDRSISYSLYDDDGYSNENETKQIYSITSLNIKASYFDKNMFSLDVEFRVSGKYEHLPSHIVISFSHPKHNHPKKLKSVNIQYPEKHTTWKAINVEKKWQDEHTFNILLAFGSETVNC